MKQTWKDREAAGDRTAVADMPTPRARRIWAIMGAVEDQAFALGGKVTPRRAIVSRRFMRLNRALAAEQRAAFGY